MSDYTLKVFTSYEKASGKKASFEISVDTAEKANAHALQILKEGYRRQVDENTYDWISPNAIMAVRVAGPGAAAGYSDSDITA